MKRIYLIILAAFLSCFFDLCAVNWYNDVELAISDGERLKKPVIFIFYNGSFHLWKNRYSKELMEAIDQGLFNSIEKHFLFAKVDVRYKEKAEKSARAIGINLGYPPDIISIDYNPVRGMRSPSMYNQGNFLSRLASYYYRTGSSLLNQKMLPEAIECFKIIKDIDNYYGKEAGKVLVKYRKLKNQVSKSQNTSSVGTLVQAENYFKTAKIYLNNESFNKAYAYLEKTKEIAKRGQLFNKALELQKSFEDKVDKSQLIIKRKK